MIIQIGGITTVDDAELVVAAGADHVGLVLAQGFDTPEEVAEDSARAIFDAVRGRASTVCTVHDHEADELLRIVEQLQPDVVHLLRWTDEYPPGKLTLLRSAIPRTKVMVTIPITGDESVEVAERFDGAADYLLLDTRHPETGVVGASGVVHDWALSARIVERVEHPVLLAGGLGPHNVSRAIEQVAPIGVDSLTHTEHPRARHRKDPDRVRAFIEHARHASSLDRAEDRAEDRADRSASEDLGGGVGDGPLGVGGP